MKKITQKALSLLLVMLITVTSIIALTPIKADAATVMSAQEFADKCYEIATEYKTLYVMGCFGAPMNSTNKSRYTSNHSYNKQTNRKNKINAATSDTFGFDCVCLIKGVLWGWNGNTSKTYGGATYASKGVSDMTIDTMLSKCSGVSKDFSNVEVGEILFYKDSSGYSHVGIYIGDGLAVESTPLWDDGVQVTAVANQGSKSGYNSRKWYSHGKLSFLDYTDNSSNATNTRYTVDELKEKVTYSYNQAKVLSGKSKFSGYCGTMVGYQLKALGVNTDLWAVDGKDHYDHYVGMNKTKSGYKVTCYPAKSGSIEQTLNLLTNNGTVDAYNILVGFQKGSTSSAGQTYGHVMFINGIKDGIVYFCESYDATVGGKKYAEGSVISCSISTFAKYYKGACTQFEGIVHFGWPDDADEKDDIVQAKITEGTYYISNHTGDGGYYMYLKSDANKTGTIGVSDKDTVDTFKFEIKKDGNYYLIKPVATKKGYVVCCYWKNGQSTQSGDEIALWGNDGDLSQRWILEEFSGGYAIHPADKPSLVWTRENGKIVLKPFDSYTTQVWTLEDASVCSHTYDNACDTSCNKCGETRSTSHTYDNSCDSSCNVCGATRSVSHTYDNACDTNCNTCGYERENVQHSFDSYEYDFPTHWKVCSICGEKGTPESHSTSIQSNRYDETYHAAYCTVCDGGLAFKHSYDNDCDKSCNECNYVRSVTHTYDNACDSSCNVCGATRSVSHTYDNNCDKSCNKCGEIRGVFHFYDNGCDPYCNVCGVPKSMIIHTYSNDCDSSCNVCGASRSTSHTYDNACDSSCNVCGASRSTSHTYSNNCDSSCNVCGASRSTSHTYDNSCDSSCNVCGVTRSASHTYSNGCDLNCNVCGAIRSISHTYDNACDTKCNVCGYSRSVNHAFNSGVVTKEPTEDEKGEITYTCTVCGEKKYEDVDALGDNNQPNDQHDNKDTTDGLDTTTVIIIAACVAVVAVMGTALVMKKKN